VPRVFGAILLVLMAQSSLQMAEFRPASPDTGSHLQRELAQLLKYLETHRVEAVYSVDNLLQWQIMFYSGERLSARHISATDRYPPYPAKVDSILAAGGRAALVGPASWSARLVETPLAQAVVPVGSEYVVILDPTRHLLERLRFEFLD
jgi:hypothetical protein